MFRREIKKQFNENKYNLLTQKGIHQKTQLQFVSYQKQAIGCVASVLLGSMFMWRYLTFPHFHKSPLDPDVLPSGEYAPTGNTPLVSTPPTPIVLLISLDPCSSVQHFPGRKIATKAH